MFCYQCQETAKGTGCTLRGVCGKLPEVANMQDLLMFVLKGISNVTSCTGAFTSSVASELSGYILLPPLYEVMSVR